MYDSRRSCCGFNVARNCFGGVALLVGVPLLVIVHMKTVVLTAFFVERRADSRLVAEILLEWLFCILVEACLFLLLVADPGFIGEPTELSCRCANCKMEVEDFDHHCGVLGACIGRGNMCYFILFLLFASLLCLLGGLENVVYIVLFAAAHKKRNANSSWTSFSAWRTALTDGADVIHVACLVLLSFVAVYGGAVCIFLCLRYTYLGYRGQSSVRRRRRESLRGSLALVFANVLNPQFSHKYTHPPIYAAEEMAKNTV
ncbi:hypothetical protein ABB37_03601 [Leptomonas pyrrhocoris]|uniref:Palmitoyltransferase n=1 Tax=Leptomonas pyrrhocoris TaxID=157538 RepID=A0A0M9G5H3_LEPPY|nr:hypothetical protein ABB37_03601 [Leptomonas pyrrhocoris]KPA82569.1 hypothetical protein ABB37_03601 [Leptomonas pyrrhocoris]|eukprot:XP_015661008.1 hypothetical protein ABB37_03601 [Leptomonas pyrrhocoris]